MTSAEITALKNELLNDPNAYGYAALRTAGNHGALAAALNLSRAGISVFRGRIFTDELLGCIDATEYAALTAANKQLLQIVLSTGSVDTNDSGVRGIVAGVFANGTATRTAMIAKASRQGSRAEQLFGQPVNTDDIGKALA